MLKVLLLAGFAHANGGPVTWSGLGATGDVTPKQQTEVRLVSETLKIAVLEDGDHYTVDATYHLDNPGDPRTVQFGVPMTWSEFAEEPPTEAKDPIQLSIGGAAASCTTMGKGDDEQIRDWCVVELTIPSGLSDLIMKYRAPLAYSDWETNKDPFTNFQPRTLTYHFHPAGYWAGKADFVEVTVDPGRYAKIPEGVKAEPASDTLTWRFEDVDLKSQPPLQITFDDAKYRRLHQRMHWNKKNRYGLTAKASSVLEGKQLYSVERAIDGDPGTAWCEGDEGGNGWLELTLTKPWKPNYPCKVAGLMYTPGYARNQDTWDKNNRVQKLRVGPCESKQRDEVTVDSPSEPDLLTVPESIGAMNPPASIEAFSETLESGEPGCLRVEIEGGGGEKYDDTCISEISIIVSCG